MTTATPPAPTKRIRLHQAQQDFLKSEALFRAFCGGIGSGKSWAGAYDLIRRAKPGRLYGVIAPTYSMLSDSTFRSFVNLATELGVCNAGDIKRSAPPSIQLRTGAEVLFRSADEPDRLRGPNWSGCWLDEASLMHHEVFNVAIGRLREAGEQGWLSATFTPKGRSHWTFETFATGKPNTALFRCRTRENPFLPSAFYDNVAGQYTSAVAAQELEGEFTEAEGCLFRRHWFRTVEAAPSVLKGMVRAWDLAATPRNEQKANDPDWTVGALMGKGSAGDFYILDIQRLRGTPKQVENAVRATAESDGKGVAIWMEREPGSSGVAVVDSYLRLLAGFNFHGERTTGPKAERAQPLAAQAEGGTVKLVRARWNKAFLDEIEVFPFGGHDDQVDAAALALAKLAPEPIDFHAALDRMIEAARSPAPIAESGDLPTTAAGGVRWLPSYEEYEVYRLVDGQRQHLLSTPDRDDALRHYDDNVRDCQ